MSTTAEGRWRPAIGDPSVVGWITVGAYFAVATLAARAAWTNKRSGAHREPAVRALFRFWSAVALLLLVFGINKQLDLQSLFTQVARDLALAQGWYEERRRYQVAFIAAIGALGGGGTALLALRLRHHVGRVWLAVLGLGLLSSFVLIRAASFHHVDVLLKRGNVHLNWVLELSSIAVLGIAALREQSLAARTEATRRLGAQRAGST